MITFLWLLLTVAIIVWLTVKLGLHPFLALLTGSILIGFLSGLSAGNLLGALTGGFGSTLQSIGIVIAAGTIIGEYLDRSGGAKVLAERILKRVGEKRSPEAMGITGYVVSIPVFCDSGFIVLSSLMRSIRKRSGLPIAVLAVALASGLYATHVFVPPTPGPLAAAATLDADIGRVLSFAMPVSLLVLGVSLLFSKFWCRRYTDEPSLFQEEERTISDPPRFSIAIAPILIPIFLIAMKSVAEYPTAPLGEGLFSQVLIFLGDPVIALLAGVGAAFLMVGGGRKRIQNEWLEEALKKAGIIILITGAGGAFGAVLRETDLAEFAEGLAGVGSFGMLIPFLIAAFLKTAQGSSTVAIITAAAICSPLLEPLGLDSANGAALTVLAIGAGSLTVSHVNDSYFWVVAKFSGLETSTALKTHTVATLLMGLTGLAATQLLAWLLI